MADKIDDQEDMLATMRSRMTTAVSAYSSSRDDQLEDMRFMAGSPDNRWQWPADVLATRDTQPGSGVGPRPCLTINKLPQHVRQVTNDQRQNRPSAKVIPATDGDMEVADMLNGLIRHIEQNSWADLAYDTACENQVTMGEGYIRLATEYIDTDQLTIDAFNQDLLIQRIRNSFSVYMDPMIQDPCGMDAEWCFVSDDLARDVYDRMYPDFADSSSLELTSTGDPGMSAWINEKTVRIAEYYWADYTNETINLYEGNQVVIKGSPEDKALAAQGLEPLKSMKRKKRTIKWIKTNGHDVLEEGVWPGQWIPIIRVVGNEFEIEGEILVSGIVRNAKDPQRMYNYWASQEAEMLALAPKAPFVVAAGQLEGFEHQWKTANSTNWAYLEYNPVTDDGSNQLPAPMRSSPPQAQIGLIQAKQGADEDIKSVTGQYNSSIGLASNERSGKAIMARERQADTGTYHYVDNLARAVRFVARQCVDIIPKIYDTARVARILGLDNEVKNVQIDPNLPTPVQEVKDDAGNVIEKIYNPSIGRYDVMVTTGPGYMTKRQEALDAMREILQGNPDLWTVAGDLFVRNMDWPGAAEMAERFKKILNPKVLSDKGPEVQALQEQIEAMTQELAASADAIAQFKVSSDAQKADVEAFKATIMAFDAETKRLSAINKFTPPAIEDAIVQGSAGRALEDGTMAEELDMFEREMSEYDQPEQPGPMEPSAGVEAPPGGPGDGGAPQIDPNAMPAAPGGIPGVM